MSNRQDELQGKRVRIVQVLNPFAREHVGKTGTVAGYAPDDMVSVDLDDGTRGFWARTFNLTELR